MKILCETQVINRQISQSTCKGNRTNKATLAIGLHPPASSSLSGDQNKNSELFLIHFNSQNKNGYRYKIKNNIDKVFTKFINDGKATISFKLPEHNLQIKCDPIQLKCFLRTMKLAIDGKSELNKIGLTTLATTSGVSKKLQPIYKLIVTRSSDIPIKGLPKTLKELQISIGCNRINLQILELNNLTKLILSENHIKFIPKELGDLNLIELDLTSNELGYDNQNGNNDNKNLISYEQKWGWLNGKQIRKTLKHLNISDNKLKYFPHNIVKLDNLDMLRLNNNEIEKIPFAIRRLTKLRFLYLNSNHLKSLPNTMSYLKLDVLDLWNNKFLPITNLDKLKCKFQSNKVKTLWTLAAQVVLNKRITYSESEIPSTIVDYLSEMPLCDCGSLCDYNQNTLFERITFIVLDNIKQLFYTNRDRLIYADAIFCSEKCFNKNYTNLILFTNTFIQFPV